MNRMTCLQNIFDFTTADVKCRLVAVKRLLVRNRSVGYTFGSFGATNPFQLH